MNIKKVRAYPVLLVLLCATPVLQAQSWYQVEVIVFAYTEARHLDGEELLGEVELPLYDGTIDLMKDVPEFVDEPTLGGDVDTGAGDTIPMAFKDLRPDQLRLQSEASRLARVSNHEILLHVAWRQPSLGNKTARAVHLVKEAELAPATSGGWQPAPAELDFEADGFEPYELVAEQQLIPARPVEGVVRLRASRLLHIDADVVYRPTDGPAVRIAEQRQVKLEETHYFDHPAFGLLVQVTPYVGRLRPDEVVVGE